MKNIYKKIARKIFMHAYYNELCEIGCDIRNLELKILFSISVPSEVDKSLGKLEALDKLDLLS